MAYEATKTAIESDLPLTEKMTLIVLAYYLNSISKECYPSYKSIAKLGSLGVSTVMAAVASLKKKGLVSIDQRFTASGDRTSNQFHLIGLSKGKLQDTDNVIQVVDEGVIQVADPNKELLINKEIHRQADSDEPEMYDGEDFDEQETTEEPKASAEKENIPYTEIVKAYHTNLPQLPRKLIITPQIKAAIKARWKQNRHHRNIEFWTQYFIDVNLFEFYAKPVPGQWKCTFDFLVTPKGFNQMIERIDDHLRRSQ